MESKYGKNELDDKVFCPRCCCAVPVFIRKTTDRFGSSSEIHCLKCRHHGHKDGTIIKELN